jgi:hypothetical protein
VIGARVRRLVRRPETKTATLPRVPAAGGGVPRAVWAQSLADGALGHVLADVELALSGELPWAHVESAFDELGTAEPDVSSSASLFYGAPAISFVLDAATANGYTHPAELQEGLDQDLADVVRRRLAPARARQMAGTPPMEGEFGLLHGLLGLGVVLLRRAPASEALNLLLDDVLRYVVDLARPRLLLGLRAPGWYVPHDPAPGVNTPGGHVSNTLPDGAAGLLAFLALCAHAGHDVPRQQDAIGSLVKWFALTRQDGPGGSWWPAWVTPDQIHDLYAGRPLAAAVPPPSWSGLAGMARAVQMGAATVGDTGTRNLAEATIAACLTPRQIRRLTTTGLQDGLAGLYQVGRRAEAGSANLGTGTAGDLLRDLVVDHEAADGRDGGAGFLTGTAGIHLATQTMRRVNGPISVWDMCLLIA